MKKYKNKYTMLEDICSLNFSILYTTFLEKSFKNKGKSSKYYRTEQNASNDIFLDTYDEKGNKETRYIIEIKARKIHYDTLILEKGKFKYLKDILEKEKEEGLYKNYKILYLNFTPKSTYIFDLTEQDFQNWNKKWLPKTTASTSFNKYKDITYLNIEDDFCKKINYVYRNGL